MYDLVMIDYDNVLIGRSPRVNAELFYGKENVTSNHYQALKCLRYIIEKILEWDENTAIKRFDRYIIRILRLESIIRYIDFPPEIPKNDVKYILSLLYPKSVKIDTEKFVYSTFERVLNGVNKQFPRDFFLGSTGFGRFCYCIKYIIEKELLFTNIPDIYDYFYSAIGRKKLADCRLKVPAYQYNIDLKNVIYALTYNEPDAELWYCYYRFTDDMKELNKQSKKEKTKMTKEKHDKIEIKPNNEEDTINNLNISKNTENELEIDVTSYENYTEEELLKRIEYYEKDDDDEALLKKFLEAPIN